MANTRILWCGALLALFLGTRNGIAAGNPIGGILCPTQTTPAIGFSTTILSLPRRHPYRDGLFPYLVDGTNCLFVSPLRLQCPDSFSLLSALHRSGGIPAV